MSTVPIDKLDTINKLALSFGTSGSNNRDLLTASEWLDLVSLAADVISMESAVADTLRSVFKDGPLWVGDVVHKSHADWLKEKGFLVNVTVQGSAGFVACTIKGAHALCMYDEYCAQQKAEQNVANIEDHMALTCENCGSVSFVLLKSGSIECYDCQTKLNTYKVEKVSDNPATVAYDGIYDGSKFTVDCLTVSSDGRSTATKVVSINSLKISPPTTAEEIQQRIASGQVAEMSMQAMGLSEEDFSSTPADNELEELRTANAKFANRQEWWNRKMLELEEELSVLTCELNTCREENAGLKEESARYEAIMSNDASVINELKKENEKLLHENLKLKLEAAGQKSSRGTWEVVQKAQAIARSQLSFSWKRLGLGEAYCVSYDQYKRASKQDATKNYAYYYQPYRIYTSPYTEKAFYKFLFFSASSYLLHI